MPMGADGGLRTNDRFVVAAAPALGAFVVLGLVAVVVLPALGADLPWETDPEPNATQVALTAFGVLLLTAGYVWAVARSRGWGRRLALLTLGYLGGIAVAKFVLSPASFHNNPDAELSEYLWLGIGVMVLYVGALVVLYALVPRAAAGGWPGTWRAGAVAGVLVFALASRYVAALVFGRDVGDYLADVFRGGGLWLVALLVVSTLAAIEAFGHPFRASAFATGLCVVIVYHGLWVAYMFRLFD